MRIPFDIKTKSGDRLDTHRKKEVELREEEEQLIARTIRRRFIDSIAAFMEHPEIKTHLSINDKIRLRAEMDTIEKSLNNNSSPYVILPHLTKNTTK